MHSLKSFSLFLIGPSFIFAALTAASAEQVAIGGVSIDLPSAGFCELAASNPADNYMLTKIGGLVAQGGNKLLSMSADCRQLVDWRAKAGKYLDDYLQYQTPIGQMDQLVASPEVLIQNTCVALRAQGDQAVSNNAPDIKARIEETLKTVKMNELRFIGVLDEDRTACYAAMLQKLQNDSGAEKTQIIVFAVAVVKNKTILAYRFAVDAGADTAANLLAKLKDVVAALYAANR